MKWLVMMSPEQLPRIAPATSGERGEEAREERRRQERRGEAGGRWEMFCLPQSAPPHFLCHVTKKDTQAIPVVQQ